MLFRFSLYGFLKNQRFFEPFIILFFLDKGLSFTLIGVLVAILGIGLRTPQLEIGSVLLIISAHVCYHVFRMMGVETFEAQPNYVLYTCILATLTYFGGPGQLADSICL